MNTMKWLVRREFWENKGGFFWAPVVVGGIAALFAIVAAIAGSVMVNKHADELEMHAEVGQHAEAIGGIGDIMLVGGVGLTMAVLAFVLFFYVLGSLYDDRRDRSILFWKSMPISDLQMVLSKAAWALLLAPLVALGIGLVLGVVFWVIGLLATTANGVPGAKEILLYSHPFKVVTSLLLALPVQIVWSLPAVGWLMLCSAWSRRLPFLWATSVPVLTCAMISFTDIFPGIEIAHDSLWYTVAYRGLFSIVPGSWIPTIADGAPSFNGPEDLSNVIGAGTSWQVFASADVWIGAVLGVAMIFAAIRLRRWRDEG